ncbi:hypothetical protein HJC23_001623 [Cyclotella cryptica]|uniref:THO complex subunit 7 n=1 Tax=Cyclotella cryptica TaxID=29204 RepID=A0ABD3QMP5_9STRA|eukprot:CCRYP_004647-RA/>CCRYP_004647-RA protein AED:0.37 eAED:0.37 QI:40/-1/1/1/-1/1/1/34/263
MMTTPSSFAPSTTTLTNETLRERILIGGSKPDAVPVRGTLSKAASRFRDLMTALRTEDRDAVDDATTGLQSEIALHDIEMRKLFLSSRAYDSASSKSRSSLSTMCSSLASMQNNIESLTAELSNERKIKRNREEYNTLAGMMNSSHPAGAFTRDELKAVESEIAKTKEDLRQAQWAIGVREKQVRMLMASLSDLKEVLREEDWRSRRSSSLGEDFGQDDAAAVAVGGGDDSGNRESEGSGGGSKRMRLNEDSLDSDPDTACAL